MIGILYFFLAVLALFVGYFIYSRVVERIFIIDPNRPVPADKLADGADFVKLPPAKVFLIQLLNIAGMGPIFGPILGALYGPSALIWIVLGSIFAGGVHDYFSGMLSERYLGKSIPDVVGFTLGNTFKHIMRGFSIVLLLLVGAVFVLGPADILATETGSDKLIWIILVFIYYFLATILPIDVIIGRLYPIFAIVLIIMAVGVISGLIYHDYTFYNWLKWENQHPEGLPIWPLLFVTIACGALSGFHATQSPMMARCLPNERYGRPAFYGAMIAEGIIALIWATAGMTFYSSASELIAAMPKGNPAIVVNTVCKTLLGPVGGFLAIIGVVILPITSGDTAFRAARLVIADILKIPQKTIDKRLLISVPLFIIGIAITTINFNLLWRYFGWANQALATIVLWTAAAYLVKRGTCHWIATIPATIMTAVVVTYICMEKIGLNLSYDISFWAGIVVASLTFFYFMLKKSWFIEHVVLELSYPEDRK